MTVLTAPADKNHGYVYNNVNLPVSYAPPVSGATQYVYDRDRRLKEVHFPSGKQITNVYTATQLTQVQTAEGNIDLTYLASGKLSTVSKGGEMLAYTYDGFLPTSETSAGTLSHTLSYTYNNDFDVTGVTYAGATSAFGYDNDGLLTSASGFTIGRNATNGLPLTVGNGTLNLTRTFDAYGEVATQSSTVNAAAVGAYTLTYNNNGQIATKSETVAGITSDYRYTYDPVGRLTQVEKDGVVVEEYGYTNGIRSSETNTLRGISRSLTYNAEDQLLTAGSTTYQYNADGFLWHKVDGGNTTTYDYSSRGELLSAALPDTRNIEYVYDALGRRIAKRVNGTTVEKYLWSGLTQLLAVYDGSDNLLMRFNYADSRTPASMMKYDAAHPTGATYYLVYDQVGSLRAVSDGAGTIVKRIDYDSFGNILTDTDPTFTVPFGFAGGLHDRDTGLVKFGFRDYDPETGRWTAKDPIGFEGGDVDVYGYVESDPVNFIDPDGEFAFLALIPLAYAAIEIGLSVSDAYSTGSTLLDPCASGGEKMSSLGLFMIGALAPGGGYSTAGKKTSKYWQYFTKGWKNFKSKWFVKGVNGKPPYKLGKEARGALNLPPKNRGTAVQPYEPRKIVGPRTPKAKPEWDWPNKGKGKEYFDGDSFPD